jgi:hypothetical protein
VRESELITAREVCRMTTPLAWASVREYTLRERDRRDQSCDRDQVVRLGVSAGSGWRCRFCSSVVAPDARLRAPSRRGRLDGRRGRASTSCLGIALSAGRLFRNDARAKVQSRLGAHFETRLPHHQNVGRPRRHRPPFTTARAPRMEATRYGMKTIQKKTPMPNRSHHATALTTPAAG